MSTNPTTKAQVQAYRFVLRRMESALVRKDAVMLHEPMRHHLRATAVGLLLGLLGLAAFFVVGKLHPTSHASGLPETVSVVHGELPHGLGAVE
ncbi:MAG TPA: type VII secretion protein EccB [Pseudonocardiaceae bacterium]|jgi:hypothetical protein|nr:type VII secretion protein EccB [Pseudonocardiaceae bacterium]